MTLFLWDNEEEFVQLFFLCAAFCLSHSVYSSIFFLENTTVPNLREVKENMTMGTTLVTDPNGGFLVRGTMLFIVLYMTVSFGEFLTLETKAGQIFAYFCKKPGSKHMFTGPLNCLETEGLSLRASQRGFMSWECNRIL